MESPIGLTLTGKSDAKYHLERYLGGGQTAHVYEALVDDSHPNPQRRGIRVAVKMMVAGLDRETQRRFWQEEAFLQRLSSGLKNRAGQAQPLVPEVWDSGDSIRGQFLVLTLARGKPLDELLRAGVEWSEDDALHLIEQLTAVFRSLHSNVQRTYLDFQPRNIFWEAASRSICVIDWNLLSRFYGTVTGEATPEEARIAAAAYSEDLLLISRLFYRLLLGQEPAGISRLALASAPRWSKLTHSMRILLWDLLQADSHYMQDGARFQERITAEIVRRTMPGEMLLKEASDLIERITERNEETPDPLQEILWKGQAQALLELAERSGMNRAWIGVLDNLWDLLGFDQHSSLYLEKGQAFLRAGDRRVAIETFAEGVRMATTPTEQLLCWRWLLFAQISLSKDESDPHLRVYELLTRITDVAPTQAEHEEIRRLLEQTPDHPYAPVLNEICAQFDLAQLLGLNLRTIDDPGQADDWIRLLGEATEHLNQLTEEADGESYRHCAWSVVGDRIQGQGEERVQEKLTQLYQRQAALQELAQAIQAVQTPDDALKLLHSRSDFAVEISFSNAILAHFDEWLDEETYIGSGLTLLSALALERQSEENRQRIERFRLSAVRRNIALQWIGLLENRAYQVAQTRLTSFSAADLEDERETVVEAPRASGIEPTSRSVSEDLLSMAGLEENQEIVAEAPVHSGLESTSESIPGSSAADAAIDPSEYSQDIARETGHFLEQVYRDVPQPAPNRLLGHLIDRFVHALIRLHLPVDLFPEGLSAAYSDRRDELITRDQLRGEIEDLALKSQQATEDHARIKSKLQRRFQTEMQKLVEAKKSVQSEVDDLKHSIAGLGEDYAKRSEAMEADLERDRKALEADNKRKLEGLERRLSETQDRLAKVEQEYKNRESSHQKRSESYREAAERHRKDLNGIQSQLKKLQDEYARTEDNIRASRRQIEVLDNSYGEKSRKLIGLEDDMQQQLTLKKDELLRLQREISDLHEQQMYEDRKLKDMQKQRKAEEIHREDERGSSSGGGLIKEVHAGNIPGFPLRDLRADSVDGNHELNRLVNIADKTEKEFSHSISPGIQNPIAALDLLNEIYFCWRKATEVQRGRAEELKAVERLESRWKKAKERYYMFISEYQAEHNPTRQTDPRR